MEDRQKLIALLAEVNEDIDFAAETALVDDGLIDSLDMTVIIAAIDEAFDVHITTADIEPEHFNSVDAMLRLIQRHRERP